MKSKGIGINTHGGTIDGNLIKLENDLDYFQSCGVDYAELCTHATDIIANGKLNMTRVDQTLKIIKKFDLKYSMHAPNDLNLLNVKRMDLQMELFKSCIDFSNFVEAEIMVYHAGIADIDYEEAGWTLEALKERERKALMEILPYAKKCGITIAVENSNPLPPELFEHKGKVFAYGSFIDQLVDQIKIVGDDNIGITLDIGHLYLAAKYYGFDFFESIKLAAPYLKHLHVHDNFGKVMSSSRPYMYLLTFGEDDLHMPIGWGEIPYKDILSNIKIDDMIFMMELKPRYVSELAQCVKDCRSLLS